MKAISLTQPWATLVAIGAKRIETRSWRTSFIELRWGLKRNRPDVSRLNGNRTFSIGLFRVNPFRPFGWSPLT